MGEKGICKFLNLLHYDFDFEISFVLIFLSTAHLSHLPHVPHAICDLGVGYMSAAQSYALSDCVDYAVFDCSLIKMTMHVGFSNMYTELRVP